MTSLAIFDEDFTKQKEGTEIYPLTGEDMYFKVPRVGGFEYNKQIRAIIKAEYGVYHESENVDMDLINAIWLGEYVTHFGGIEDAKTKKQVKFTRDNCRAIFRHKGYQQSLCRILINKASTFEAYLTKEGREAIEELKKQ